MKLRDQVCTLEQAKKLKELGIVQDSLFYHIECNPNVFEIEQIGENFYKNYDKEDPVFSAFTVAELGMMLGGCDFTIKPFAGGTYELRCVYLDSTIYGNSWSDCLAQAVVSYISDSKLQTQRINYRLQQINKRLEK